MAVGKSQNRQTRSASLKKFLKKCSSFGKRSLCDDGEYCLPDDMLKGHFEVYVGENRTRHIVPISWLARPKFQYLLRRAKEEYGFNRNMGTTIPCEERVFQTLASIIS